MNCNEIRTILLNQPLAIARQCQEILSLNFVGSFAEGESLDGIGDIDVVIIVPLLTETLYNSIISRFEMIRGQLPKNAGLTLVVNSTFGPLKFYAPNQVVYHVMIYDLAGHLEHCRKSPFTCLDWCRSKIYAKLHISAFFPEPLLMPHHFFNVRRSVREYLEDYERQVITYRSYRFFDQNAFEQGHEKMMTEKDRHEFAYHIVRFVMTNFLKMVTRRNVVFPLDEMINRFVPFFPALSGDFPARFRTLSNQKKTHCFDDEPELLDCWIKTFLEEFERGFHHYFPEGRNEIFFCRHGKTQMNDGKTFLGRKLNPPLADGTVTPQWTENVPGKIYSSPSRRAIETATKITGRHGFLVDERLAEIDYGLAEGHGITWLRKHFPEIPTAWANGEDMAFPEGESQAAILQRVESFIEGVQENICQENMLIVTHNVWLRTLFGSIWDLPSREWYRINIPHSVLFRFRRSPATSTGILPDCEDSTLDLIFSEIRIERLLNALSIDSSVTRERWQFWREYFRSRQSDVFRRKRIAGTTLLPMAGAGRRFADDGFVTSKPLIPVDGQPMIAAAVAGLPLTDRIIYLVRQEVLSPELENTLRKTAEQVTVIPVERLTEGQASTCLLGEDHFMTDEPLLIAPCDNAMCWQPEEFQKLIDDSAVDIICWTFTKHYSITVKPQEWGYVAVDQSNNATAVSVKKPLTDDPYSEHCIIGTFWFRSAGLFKLLAHELIARNIRVNGEFYVDSIIQLAIAEGYAVKIFDVDQYVGLGRPEDLFEYRKWSKLVKFFYPQED